MSIEKVNILSVPGEKTLLQVLYNGGIKGTLQAYAAGYRIIGESSGFLTLGEAISVLTGVKMAPQAQGDHTQPFAIPA